MKPEGKSYNKNVIVFLKCYIFGQISCDKWIDVSFVEHNSIILVFSVLA